jgi:MFS family permease
MKERPEPGAWTVVTMLFLFIMINFLDKAVFGLAGVPIMRDLNLTPSQFGFINSAFFFLFSISAVVVGFVVNRVQSRWVIAAMALVWALAQFPMMIGAAGYAIVLVSRIALGAGEGPAYPVALHSTYKFFPKELRNLPASIITQGAGVGLLIVLPLLNEVIIAFGWRTAFGLLGCAGLVWLAVWSLIGREGTLDQQHAVKERSDASAQTVPYWRLILCPSILALWCAYFGAYWVLSLRISWMTPYLVSALGYSQHTAGYLSAIPWGLSVVGIIAISWLSQRLLIRGVSSRLALGMVGGGCVAIGGMCLAVLPLVQSAEMKVALLAFASAFSGVIFVFSNTVMGELVPVHQRGAMLAIGSAVGSSSGVIAPYLMGDVVQKAATILAGYDQGFLTGGVIMMVTGLAAILFVRPERDREHLYPTRRDTPDAGAPSVRLRSVGKSVSL